MSNFNLQYLKPSAFISLCVVMVLGLGIINKYLSNHWGATISVVAIISGLLTLVDRFLWNKKPFCWLYDLADFSGTYSGTLTYRYRNENFETITNTLKHTKVIYQNGSTIKVESWTIKEDGSKSSISTSETASIIKKENGTYCLIYNYLNEGSHSQEFSPHFGTEVLKLTYRDGKKLLIGRYYTERQPYQTKGEIELMFKSKNNKYIN